MIQQKIDNAYNQIVIHDLNINSKYKECRRLLYSLEKAREEFNKKVDDIKSIQKELKEINNEIAYYEIIS